MRREKWLIHPSVKIPEWVRFEGKHIRIDEGVKFLSRGFGYAYDSKRDRYFHIPHSGIVIIEDYVEIHADAKIDRATVDSTFIGRGTKIDRDVHIAHNSYVGRNCLVISKALLEGGCHVEDGCHVGGGVIINDHVRVAESSFIGSGAVVVKDIVEPGGVWAGVPARYLRERTEEDR